MTSMCLRIAACAVLTFAGGIAVAQTDKLTTPTYIVLDPNAPRPAVAEGQPVPEFRPAPTAPKKTWGVPRIHSTITDGSETIELANDATTVKLVIDRERHVRIASIRTGSGHELLSGPAACLVVVNEKGGIVKDGAEFVVNSWLPRQHSLYTEAEFRLSAPEAVTWRVRLYRDKPYIEQQFSVPREWRSTDRSVAQVLPTVDSLKPVMPNNSFGRGFSGGKPNVKGRHRFEFVAQSDHLCYDAKTKTGMAAFVAGVGGEERVQGGRLAMLDHSIVALDGEPVGRFIVWPFEGPVENGFTRLKRFIAGDYSCQRGKSLFFSWNQFWLWQGGIEPADYSVVTAKKLLDILPYIAAVGCEEFHLDAGWETGPGDWRFDAKRFPDGFEPLRRLLRQYGMRYHTWMNTPASEDPALLSALIEQTDMCKLFQDRTVDERSIAAMREVRRRYPDFETFVHHSTSRSAFYRWGNIHFLSDFNQVYFGEGEFWAWSNVLPENPEGDTNKRFFSRHSLRAGDLVTRSAAYEVNWAWPYTTIVPPHCGWAWFEDRPLDELASRMFTSIAARADYQWGEDPRMLRPEVLSFFMDWTAFFKAVRPYLQEYQHVLPVPDGVHVDGAAHVVDGRGFIVLCNPGSRKAEVSLKELLWEPELELDPRQPVKLSDWTKPLAPAKLRSVDLAKPEGSIEMQPLSYKVISVNVDVDATLAEVKRQRSMLHGPPK